MQQYPSQLLERAVEAFSQLPGVGRKTALRLVLHLLRQSAADVDGFADAVVRVRHDVKYCKVCTSQLESLIYAKMELLRFKKEMR